MEYNIYIDHTLLKPEASVQDIIGLCEEAKKYKFKAVCVNPTHVRHAKELLKDTEVLVCTVIGFPLGASTMETKVFETKNALENGADEIDMVINIGRVKIKDFDYVEKEIKAVAEAAKGKTVKVIIETCLLTKEEIVLVCERAKAAKAHFVKTSTGFSKGGATLEDVGLMKKTVGEFLKVKASGGIRSKNDLLEMIKAGADRIGTSSGVKIMNEGKEENK